MDLTLDDLQQRIGMLMMELWKAGKIITSLQQQVAALTPPATPKDTP
jgi:hypothetical protein